jgi:molecular chaperone DnaJ
MASKRDYYEVLGVARDASPDDLKKAYRKLAVKFHPDKNPGDHGAEERFKELGEAYEALSDPEKRAAYDRFGHAAFQAGGAGGGGGGGGFHDAADIFNQVFGAAFGFQDIFGGQRAARRDPAGRARGNDLRYDLEISLEEAASGTEKEVHVDRFGPCETCSSTGSRDSSGSKRCTTCNGAGQVISSRGFFQVQQTCPACQGTGSTLSNPCPACRGEGRARTRSTVRIRIPQGVDTGVRLRTSGQGDAGTRGGPAGDLYVVIHLRDHDLFEREGDDLQCAVPVPFPRAALGGEVKVPTLDGCTTIKVPPAPRPAPISASAARACRCSAAAPAAATSSSRSKSKCPPNSTPASASCSNNSTPAWPARTTRNKSRSSKKPNASSPASSKADARIAAFVVREMALHISGLIASQSRAIALHERRQSHERDPQNAR